MTIFLSLLFLPFASIYFHVSFHLPHRHSYCLPYYCHFIVFIYILICSVICIIVQCYFRYVDLHDFSLITDKVIYGRRPPTHFFFASVKYLLSSFSFCFLFFFLLLLWQLLVLFSSFDFIFEIGNKPGIRTNFTGFWLASFIILQVISNFVLKQH